ncbi:hypothetical protein I7I48_09699 [Histoplasma ohiense]|nr:hypothetical protein I7I48_09699 [Histoplasma ohiense (nom. inval.)]
MFTYFYSPQGSGVRVENVSNCLLDSYTSGRYCTSRQRKLLSQRWDFVNGAANLQSSALVVKACRRYYYGRAFLNTLRRSTNYLPTSEFIFLTRIPVHVCYDGGRQMGMTVEGII